jgi:hypothetical protein
MRMVKSQPRPCSLLTMQVLTTGRSPFYVSAPVLWDSKTWAGDSRRVAFVAVDKQVAIKFSPICYTT